jgi:hypothetical protein
MIAGTWALGSGDCLGIGVELVDTETVTSGGRAMRPPRMV